MRALVFLLLLTLPACADDKREIDFTQRLVGLTGEELKQCVKPDHKDPAKCAELGPITLGDAALYALLSDDERGLDPRKKWERERLARKVWKNAHAVLSPADAALIQDRIGRVYPATTIGAAWPLLDPTLAEK